MTKTRVETLPELRWRQIVSGVDIRNLDITVGEIQRSITKERWARDQLKSLQSSFSDESESLAEMRLCQHEITYRELCVDRAIARAMFELEKINMDAKRKTGA